MTDQEKINHLTAAFFQVFTNIDGRDAQVQKLHDLFIPEGLLISNTGGHTAVFTVQEFHHSRQAMLSDGTLTQFQERETDHSTDLMGNIAQRECQYVKSGIMNGIPFSSYGRKSLQFIKTGDEWRLTSVVWCDHQPNE